LNVKVFLVRRQYSKSKLELESNFSGILPVHCKFIRGSTLTKFDKGQTRVPEVWQCKKKKDTNTNEFFLRHTSSTFFEFSSSMLLEYS